MNKGNIALAILFTALYAVAGLNFSAAVSAADYHRDGRDYRPYPIYADGGDKRWKDPRQLSKEDREQLKRKREYYESLPPAEQEKIRRARERYEEMSPEQKQQVRKRWEQMSPDERKQYRKWKKEQKNGR